MGDVPDERANPALLDVLRRGARRTWSLVGPYWTSDERGPGGLLLAALVALSTGLVYLNVVFTRWNSVFYNALQDRNYAVFSAQLARFSGLAALFIVLTVYQLYLNQMLQIRWRRWVTERYLSAWLGDRAYYRLQVQGREGDNPDQRIAEDARLFVTGSLTLFLGGLGALITLGSFTVILWQLSGDLRVSLRGATLAIPGYMVWLAVVYALGGTWLTTRIGRRLTALNYDQQRFEADSRVALVRLRESAEAVAFHRGEADELAGFRTRFGEVVRNWWGIMRRQKQLGWFTASDNQVAVVFPFLMAAPRYFSGAIPLGGLVRTALAFAQVQQALSFVVNVYPDIAEWRAVVDRLAEFEAGGARVQARRREPGIRLVEGAGGPLTTEGLALSLPDGQPLLGPVSFTVSRGDTILLTGASGSGTSTLMRALAGLWPFGVGTIQQRIAFARALAQRPEWLFLDEATAALGEAEEAELYGLLPRWLPGATVLSVGHRASLRAFHGRHWMVVTGPGTTARLDLDDVRTDAPPRAPDPEPMLEVPS